jgi:pyrroloquinoline quinone biosynthesis protein B
MMLLMAIEMRVLGSAAGGGFPQWNCGCPNCARARAGQLPMRTQDCVAVSGNSQDWFLLNASPDVARQIERTQALWPRARRGSPIRGVVLTNGDLDHVLGLFSLREAHPISVYSTPEVRSGLEQNSMLRTLMRFDGQLRWETLALGRELELASSDGSKSGILLRPFAAPGKPPLHLMSSALPSLGDNVGLSLRAREGASAVYLSATSDVESVAASIDGAAVLLFDGTFWSETELIDANLGRATAREMAHLPIGGDKGSLARGRGLRAGRRLYTHINNTNPILDPQSAERALLQAEGWELAEDGMRLVV